MMICTEMRETGKSQVMIDIMVNALRVPSGSPRTQGTNALRIAFGLCITPPCTQHQGGYRFPINRTIQDDCPPIPQATVRS